MVERGVLEATTDSARVNRWWDMWPDANIGIGAGASGLVVIDVDPRHGGDESLAMLRAAIGGDAFETVTALTGGGGQHLYFAAPEAALAPGAGVLGDGIDVRAGNSYVIAPPSRHSSGQKYRWEVSYGPLDIAPIILPDPLLQRLLDAAKRPAPTLGEVEMIPDGGRNVALSSLAGSLRRRGLGQDEIYAALVAVNNRRCNPPLPDGDLVTIAKSISRYAPETPLSGMVVATEPAESEMANLVPVPVGKSMLQSWTLAEDTRRYSTGFATLDAVLGMLHPGELTLLGAWTGVGKSGFAEQVALEVAKSNSVLFFPLELGIIRTETRMLAKLMQCSEDWVTKVRSKAHVGDKTLLASAIEELQDRKIEMVSPAAGDAFAYAHIRKLVNDRRPDLVIIDHMQHIDDWVTTANSRAEMTAPKIVRDLRKLAESTGVHFLLVHQLKAEKIQKKQRPQMYDFADTAALPRVADTVLCLHRPFRGFPRMDVVSEILVLKNRRGPEPWIHTHFVGESIAMYPMTVEEQNSVQCCPKDAYAEGSL